MSNSFVESVSEFSKLAVILLKQISLCSLTLELSFTVLSEGLEEREELSSDSRISSVRLKRFLFLSHGHMP